MNKPSTLVIAGFLALQSCQPSQPGSGTPVNYGDTVVSKQKHPPKVFVAKNGKQLNVPVQEELFQQVSLDTFYLPVIDSRLMQALDRQLELLQLRKQKRVQQIGNLRINLDDLKTTIQILQSYQ